MHAIRLLPLLLIGCAARRHSTEHAETLAALDAQRQQLAALQSTLSAIETEQMNLRARQDDLVREVAIPPKPPSGSFAMLQETLAGIEQKSDALLARLDTIEAQLSRTVTPDPTGAKPKKPGQPDPAAVYRMPIDGAQSRGSASAKVTIVECSDFQCPFCGRVRPTLDELAKEYGDELRIVFKNNPLPMHNRAFPAAVAAEAAGRQGKFWAMHDQLFDHAKELTDENFVAWATELDLDITRFKRDLDDPKLADRVRKQSEQCISLGARGTPSFFVNGRYLSGAQPAAAFRALIDEEKPKAEALLRKGVKPKKLYDGIIKAGKKAP